MNVIVRKMRAPLIAALLIAPFGGAKNACAQESPQWHGENRDGIVKSEGVVLDFTANKPAAAWTFRNAGQGYASPAIAGGVLYCQGAENDADFVFALDAASGTLKWKQRLGELAKYDRGNGPRGTITIDGGKLYCIRGGGGLHCLAAADGKLLWTKDFIADFGGKLMSDWGFSESPLVDGNLLICTPGGSAGAVVALDKNSGATVWRSAEWAGDAGYSSPIVAEIGGVRQYIQQAARGVAGLDAKTGRLLWKTDIAAYKTAVITTPVYHNNMVFVTSAYGAGCTGIKIEHAAGAFTAKTMYAHRELTNHHGGVLLVDGYLYGFSDTQGWTCMDLATGKTVWKQRIRELGKGALICVNNRLLLQDERTGLLGVVAASPAGWQEFGRMEFPERTELRTQDNCVWAHPVVAAGRLYVRDHDLLFCYNLKK